MKLRYRMLPLLAGFAALATGADAQTIDTLRYSSTTLQQYQVLSQPNIWYLQRFRNPSPVEVVGFRARVYATSQPGSISMAIFRDAGGSGLPEMIDMEIADTATLRAMTVGVPQPQNVYVTEYTVPKDRRLILEEPGQFYVGAISSAGVGVLFDPAPNTQNMCQDADPGTVSNHELSVVASYIAGGARQWTVITDENQQILNGSMFIEVLVRPLEVASPKTFERITSTAFDAPPTGMQPAWGDVDNDGDHDLLNSGVLWVNDNSGRFTRNSAVTGIPGLAIFLDADNDGLLDIVSATKIFRNNGDGTFAEQSETGLVDAPANTTLTAADYDGDGLVDLFVGTWERQMKVYNAAKSDSADVFGVGYKDHLYRNLGGFKFRETTDQALKGYGESPRGFNQFTNAVDVPGYPVLYSSNWLDYDRDGDMDLFWGVYRLAANYLWRNNGDGTFTDVARETKLIGIEETGYAGAFGHVIGSDFADYDNDGDIDAALGQLAHPRFYDFSDRTAIYNNNGSGLFTDLNNSGARAGLLGIPYNETHADVAWGDYDNDGLQDLYVNAVYDCYNSGIYRQKEDGTFQPQNWQTGIATDGVRGLAWVDIENDGDLDLYVGGARGGLFRNQIATAGRGWIEIGFRLKEGANRFGVGARVQLFSGGKRYERSVSAGYGSQSQMPFVTHFGLANGTVDSVIVHLPEGLAGPGGSRVLRFDGLNFEAVNMITDLADGVPVDVASSGVPAGMIVEDAAAASPNPAATRTRISFSEELFGRSVALEIVSLQGETVRVVEDLPSLDGGIDLDLRGLPSGSYLVRISGEGKSTTVSLTIAK